MAENIHPLGGEFAVGRIGDDEEDRLRNLRRHRLQPLRELIKKTSRAEVLRAAAIHEGMRTLRMDGIPQGL